jgi:hypothetical protein
MRLLIVSDKTGRVLAAAHAPPSDGPAKWGIEPLRDQHVSEVAVPDHLVALAPEERLRQVLKHRLQPGEHRLSPPKQAE